MFVARVATATIETFVVVLLLLVDEVGVAAAAAVFVISD